MFVNAATDRALDLISVRASDVYKAFTPGATPSRGDAGSDGVASRRVFDPLSVALPAHDFLITTDERGRTTYTRDGALRAVDGTIVGGNGRAVMGYVRSGEPLSELRVDPVDSALGRVRNLRIESDGNVAYDRRAVDPRSGASITQSIIVGRLALARFPAGTALTPADDTSAAAPAGIVPHLGVPGDGNFAFVTPMQRQTSGIDLDRSLDRLHDAYMAFDALQAAHKAQGHTGKVAMDLLK